MSETDDVRRRGGALALALSKAQKAFPAIPKKREAKMGSYSYSYADIADILDAVRGPLCDNELAVIQPINGLELRTVLMHSSGEEKEGVYLLPDGLTAQQMGSAITYARRYSLTSMLGIATEDDDGAAATESGKAPKPAAKKGNAIGDTTHLGTVTGHEAKRLQREAELLALPAELNLSAEKAVEVMRDVIGHADMTKATNEDLDLLEAGLRGTAESIAKAFGTEQK